jgi:RNA polymerase sigma factor (sigma-70 family)
MHGTMSAELPLPAGLVREAARGDRAAFARLVDRYQRSMLRVAYTVTGDTEAARDAVQSAWTVAWRRLSSLRDLDQVGSWLVAVAANEARQQMRRQRRRPVVQISHLQEDRMPSTPAPRIETIDLERALVHLGADDRAILALRFIAGLDSPEIARHLGLSASGVRSRLARLLERLRKDLDHA